MNTNREQTLGFPRGETVLLVINPVNDFFADTGAAWELVKGTVQGHNVLENLQKAASGARERSLRVIFGAMAFAEEDYAVEALQRRGALSRLLFERRVSLAGTWGADFHPSLRPIEGEIVLEPVKGFDLLMTDLPATLEQLGASHLIICGVPAIAGLATGLHAVEAGYEVTFLTDAIAAESSGSYDAVVQSQMPIIGNGMLKVDEFLNWIDGDGSFDQIAKGDRVYSSDNADIGRIEEIVFPAEDVEPYLRVSGGLLGKDVYVPFDAVVRRIGPYVYVNVLKSMIGHLGWESAPTRNGRRAKYGFAAATVKAPFGSVKPSGPTVL